MVSIVNFKKNLDHQQINENITFFSLETKVNCLAEGFFKIIFDGCLSNI